MVSPGSIVVIASTLRLPPRIRNVWPSRPRLVDADRQLAAGRDAQALRADQVVVERDGEVAGALAHGRLRPAAGDERERARDEQGQGAGADGHRSPMLSHPMTKARRLVLIAISLAATAGGVSACGEQGISS